MDQKEWIEHISRRSDVNCRVAHLTRRNDGKDAFEVLCKILDEKMLIGSGREGFIRGNNRAVCFQDVPLYSLAENVKYEYECLMKAKSENKNTKNRYEGFGLRFNKGQIFQKGARPVIYGTKDELNILPDSEQWRCVQIDLNAANKIIDWTHEREWRIKGDFHFEYSEIEVIVPDAEHYRKFVDYCFNSGQNILGEINGVVVLDSLSR